MKLSNLWAKSLCNKKIIIKQSIMGKFNVYSSDLMAMITLCMGISSSCVRCSKCDTIEGREI